MPPGWWNSSSGPTSPRCPTSSGRCSSYRRWVDPALEVHLGRCPETQSEKLHASLALLPVDASQVPITSCKRLLDATPSELPVLRDALKPHRSTLTPKLWSVLDSAKPGDVSLLPAASALADLRPTSPRWEVGGQQGGSSPGQSSIRSISVPGSTPCAPCGTSSTAPLATIFRDKNRPESERNLATNILTDYASDDPNLIADLLMDADPKAYAALLPDRPAAGVKDLASVPGGDMRRKPRTPGTILPSIRPGPSQTPPSPARSSRLRGCSPSDSPSARRCPWTSSSQPPRLSAPRAIVPIRFRPYAEGKSLRVAAVWTRDGRPWRLAHDQSADEIRQTDERNRKEGYLPVDVAGYLAAGGDEGKPTSRFAALWAQRTRPDDDARMVVASSAAELTKAPGTTEGRRACPPDIACLAASG